MASSAPDHLRTPGLISNRPCYEGIKVQWDAQGPDGVEGQPAGTGPYQFIEHKAGELMRYQRVENHWRRTPEFEELRMFVVPEAATRLAALLAGEVDIAVIPRSFEQEVRSAGIQVTLGRFPAYHVTFAMGGQYYATPDRLDQNIPWLRPQVRMAMNLAIDRQAINDLSLGGLGEPMPVAGFHPILPGWNPTWEPYPYDPEKARQLLAEAGYPDGFALEMVVSAPGAEFEIAEALAQMFGDIGIKALMNVIDFEDVPQIIDRVLLGVPAGYRSFRETQEAVQALNYSGPGGKIYSYTDPQIDKMYEQLLQESDPQIREKLLRTIGDIKFDNYAEIPLFWVRTAVGINPKVVRTYAYPGNIPGDLSHLEYVETER